MTEQELIARYKTAGIVKGSLKPGTKHHKNKNVVTVVCRSCGHKQVIATSDLWLKNCSKCEAKINDHKVRKGVAK